MNNFLILSIIFFIGILIIGRLSGGFNIGLKVFMFLVVIWCLGYLSN